LLNFSEKILQEFHCMCR